MSDLSQQQQSAIDLLQSVQQQLHTAEKDLEAALSAIRRTVLKKVEKKANADDQLVMDKLEKQFEDA